jgi:hypothetical protein
MKRIYLLKIALIIGVNGFSQGVLLDQIDPLFQNSSISSSSPRYAEIIGTPFLTDDWLFGKVTLISGQTFDNIRLKYDAFGDLLVVNQNGKEIVIDKSKIKSFEYSEVESNEVNRFEKIELDNKFQFAQLIHEIEEIKLYTKHQKMIIRGTNQGSSYGTTTSQNDKFSYKKEMVLILDGEPKHLGGTRKEILEGMNKINQGTKEIVKKEKLKLDKPEDLITLIEKLYK